MTTCKPAEFRRACGNCPTGVTVTTFHTDEVQPHGPTVSAFTSVSLDPPLVRVCIHRKSRALKHLRFGGHFAMNVLSWEQSHLLSRFSSLENDRFAVVTWRSGRTGASLLQDAAAISECAVSCMSREGDHVIIGLVLHVTHTEQGALVYCRQSVLPGVRAGGA